MESEVTTISDSEPADTSSDAGADIGETMEAVYDAHNPGHADQPHLSGEESEHVSSDEVQGESFAPEQPAETVEPPTDVRMPQAWSKEQAAVWNSLTPDAQRYIAERELQAQRRISELGHLAKQQPSNDDFGQQFESIRAQGLVPLGDDGQPLSAPQVIESALAFDQALRQSPAEAITALAAAHNVDLAALAGAQGHGPKVEYDQFQQAYNTFQQELARQKADHQAILQQQQQDQAARYQWVSSAIDQFASGKEHWSAIEDEVIHQAAVLKSRDPARAASDPLGLLHEAEQRALKVKGIDPDTKKKSVQAKKIADQAKRMASLNVGKRGLDSRSSTATQSWDQTLADVYDRIHNYRR
jgi:hypothetical protein